MTFRYLNDLTYNTDITVIFSVDTPERDSRYTQAAGATIYGDMGRKERFVFQGFFTFRFGKSYDSAVSVSAFKRKNRISILLHAEPEK